MYRTNTKVKGGNKMTSLAIAALLFVISFSSTFAQHPALPVLSLTGQDNDYNDLWFENGRILLPRNKDYQREFVVPVFIDNRWAQNADRYIVDLPIEPITSFKFELFYDSATVTPVGIETTHPKFVPQSARNKEPLAAGFDIVWDDIVNKKYFTHMDPTQTGTTNRGHSVVITGSSIKPLPNTDLTFPEFDVLLYVRFKALLVEGGGDADKELSYLHIGRDSIYYNDFNILQEAPFVDFRAYDPQVSIDFPNPQTPVYQSVAGVVFTGLAGMDNRNEDPANLIIPGGIWFQYMNVQPEFGFEINRSIGTQPPIRLVDASNPALYELTDPITVDLNVNGNRNPFPQTGTRNVEILNTQAQTLLKNIEVVSDQPWLQFRTVVSPNKPIRTLTNEGFIPYIDNGLLGEPSVRDEQNDIPGDDGPITLEISCDPKLIAAGEDGQDDPEIEKTGIYTGYITFKSGFAGLSPVRIKVTFIYFRAPLEGQSASGSELSGINLTLTNRDNESSNMIFGTGDRATLGVDSLFGEHAYETALSTTEMEARFYPVDADGNELPELPFGIGDFATNDDQSKSNSRDIRSSDDTLRSLIYKVKFNPGEDNKVQRYPITITWNVQDFIPGSQAFIRDTENGVAFPPVDMINEGQDIGQNLRTFKIDDPSIREFIIEYTPAKLVEYVDEEGNPLINPGWNLLSTPLNPLGTGSPWGNALTKDPYYFFLSSYQQEDSADVRAGIGYFVKYGPEITNINTEFRGSNITEISPLVNPVRVSVSEEGRGGWNTVGAPSVPVNVETIEFRPYNNGTRPDINYTLQAGVWKYETKQGYQEVSELRPGLGYWIKVDNVGYYFVSAANAKLADNEPAALSYRNDIKELATEIVVADNNQSAKTLYVSNKYDINVNNFELPPLPPSFDVRFEGNTELTNSNQSIITLTNVDYPVSISAKGMNGTFELTDAATGEYFGTISSTDLNSVTINGSSNSIKVNKVETENSADLNSVYPNPVVSTSTINFNLPESGNVNVTLVDAVGNTVSNIFSGNKDAGSQSVDFNANGFTSGNYFVKVEAGTYNNVMRLQIVK